VGLFGLNPKMDMDFMGFDLDDFCWLGISRMGLMYEVVDFGLLIGLFSILMSV
jgi:hypothetical protein